MNQTQNKVDTGVMVNIAALSNPLYRDAPIDTVTQGSNLDRVKMIALSGYSRQGKDEGAVPLIASGYTRIAYGDFIKNELTEIRKEMVATLYSEKLKAFGEWSQGTLTYNRHLEVTESVEYFICGEVNAFTENDAEKKLLRPTFEEYGIFQYDRLQAEMFTKIAECLPVVNTRLMRVKEAENWVRRGGEVWEVIRDGIPKTDFERDSQQELRDSGLICRTIYNTGTKEELHDAFVKSAAFPLTNNALNRLLIKGKQ